MTVSGSMRGWAIMAGAAFHVEAWTSLLACVRTGEPAFELVHGQLAFDYLRDHPDDGAVHNAGMTSISGLQIAPVVTAW